MFAKCWLCCTEFTSHYVIEHVPNYREVPELLLMTFVWNTLCCVFDLVTWSYCGILLYVTVIGVIRVIWLMTWGVEGGGGGGKSTLDSCQEV